MPIQILSKEIVSLIAAGEVIESPASVVKELIENSIDAGAKTVYIEIKKAGRELIRVKDDGQGMQYQDLQLCVYPHSTSKIKTYEDLNSILTYGFRGEALYSVFSVSRMKIQTYNGDGNHGFVLYGEGKDPSTSKIKPAPPIKGTTIEVKDLFFNTPARKKFLKSDNSLNAAIIRVVEEFILVRPDISFSLKIDDSLIFSIKGGDLDKSIKAVFMPTTAEKMIDVEAFENGWKLKAKVSDPSSLISSRDSQYYFVNDRAVNCKSAQKAVYKAYKYIRNGKHPALAIFLKGPPEEIDVNVHPQKKEVKFKDENFIYSFIYSSIYKQIMRQQTPLKLDQQEIRQNRDFEILSSASYTSSKETHSQALPQHTQEDFLSHMFQSPRNESWNRKPITYIGQIFDSLLVFQNPQAMLIVDQHAATERILFEKYLEEFKNESIKIQDLLIPTVIEMSASKIENLMLWKNWLLKAGFEINRCGPNTITAYSTPSVFYFTPQALTDFFLYLSEILGNPSNVPEELKRNSIATLACKKSIKAREKVDSVSALKILEELSSCQDPLHCPHGRPTLIEFSIEELTRRFHRGSI